MGLLCGNLHVFRKILMLVTCSLVIDNSYLTKNCTPTSFYWAASTTVNLQVFAILGHPLWLRLNFHCGLQQLQFLELQLSGLKD